MTSESWVGVTSCLRRHAAPHGHQPRRESQSRDVSPHTVFSLSPQPINTESVPKNVVDTVSDSRRSGVGVEGNSLGGAGKRKMHLGKVNSCVWGHPSGVDLGNLGEVVGTWVTLQAGQLTSLCSEMDC